MKHFSRFLFCATLLITLGGLCRAQTVSTLLGDFWTYDPSAEAWEKITATGAPAARRNHGSAYDPVRDRVFVFPGAGAGATDTRSYSFQTGVWETIQPMRWGIDPNDSTPTVKLLPSTWPLPQHCKDAFYDPIADQIIIVSTAGGPLQTLSLEDNVLSATENSSISPPRHFSAVALDPITRKVYAFGGSSVEGNGGVLTTNTMCLDLNTTAGWSVLAVTGDIPSARWLTRGIVDIDHNKLLIFGGNRSSSIAGNNDYGDETFELDLDTLVWTRVPSTRKPLRMGQMAACYDTVNKKPVLFGGLQRIGGAITDLSCYNDTWSHDTTSTRCWDISLPSGVRPTLRRMPSMTWDTSASKAIVFGGEEIVSQSRTRTLVTLPRAGTRVSGNALHLEASITYGSTDVTSEVLFQYRAPSISGSWETIIPVSAQPNPSPSNPFYVLWDTISVTTGPVDLRALAADTTGTQDALTPFTTVIIDHDTPELVGNLPSAAGPFTARWGRASVINAAATQSWLKAQINEIAIGNSSKNITALFRFPSGTLDSDRSVSLTIEPTIVPGYPQLSDVFALDIGSQTVSAGPQITIMFSYADKNGDNIVDGTFYQASSLKIFPVTSTGQVVTSGVFATVVDTVNKTLRCKTSTLNYSTGPARYALFAETLASASDWNLYH